MSSLSEDSDSASSDFEDEQKGFSEPIKVVVIGDSGMGKTTIVNYYMGNKLDKPPPQTIGFDPYFAKVKLDSGDRADVSLFDIQGQHTVHAMTETFYKGSNGAVLVYDVSAPKTFDSLEIWRQDLIQKLEHYRQSDIPIIVFANKSDLASPAQIKEAEERLALGVKQNKYQHYFITSAKTGSRIKKGILHLISLSLEHKAGIKKKCKEEPIKFDSPKKDSSSCMKCG